MNSIKFKSKPKYSLNGGKAIAQVVILPEDGHFRIYVAWEWEYMAKKEFFAIVKSTTLYRHSFLPELINEVANHGTDITDTPEAKKLFHNLFTK